MSEPPSDFWLNTDYQRFPGGQKKLRVLAEIILSHFVERPRVLDVGCGNGSLAFPMAALGCEVVGVDTDGESVDSCTRRNGFPNLRFLQTDGTLRTVDGGFDLIVCSEVLEHLWQPSALLASMREKLAPGGSIFITIPNGYGLREIGGRGERLLRARCLDWPLDALRRILGRVGMPSATDKYEMHTSNPDQQHVQKFTRRGIIDLLRAEGLDILAWRNSFVILSVFYCRAGRSSIERLDSWAADHLPAVCASGWYITALATPRCSRPPATPRRAEGRRLASDATTDRGEGIGDPTGSRRRPGP